MSVSWNKVLVGAALFALGAAAGSWGQRLHARARHRGIPDTARIVARLDREVGLDAAQKAAATAALDARRPEVLAFHRDAFERMDALIASLHADVKKVLRPDQQAKLDAWDSQARERRRRQWGLDAKP